MASGSPMPMKTTLPTRASLACWARDHLLDDLAGGQVPLEAGLAGGAERAAHGAAGLGRHADRGPGRVAHQHGLDRGAVAAAPHSHLRVSPSSAELVWRGARASGKRLGQPVPQRERPRSVRSSSGARRPYSPSHTWRAR